jgi:hypothetical protein
MGQNIGDSRRYSIPRLYYLITPAFILLDYGVGVNVRVAVLDGLPLYKNLYYGFCVLCGVAVYLLPVSSPFVALGESSINVLLTILALFLPYVQNLQRLADLEGDWKVAGTFSTEGAVNLVLAATMAVVAFVQSNKALSDRFEQATHNSSAWRQGQDQTGPF